MAYIAREAKMPIKLFGLRPLRDMRVYSSRVTSLEHVALVPEVQHTLLAWVKAKTGSHAPGVLIGGLALSFYVKPRETTDVDLLFLSPADVPGPREVPGFRRHRPSAFQENQTHIEVEVTTVASFNGNLPPAVAQKVFATAVNHSGMKVASLEGLLALKLCSSFSTEKRRFLTDCGDIENLLNSVPTPPDLKEWPLEPRHFERYEKIISGTLL